VFLVNRGVISEPPLERPARRIVLYAKTLVVHQVSVVTFGYKIDFDDKYL
jgi:hypothetical protein